MTMISRCCTNTRNSGNYAMHCTIPASSLRPSQAELHYLPVPQLGSLFAAERPGQPIESFVKTVTRGRACRLDKPLSVPHVVQTELFGDFCCRHGIWKILFVCEDKQHCVAHLVLIQHLRQLLARIFSTVSIVAVHHEDQTLCALVIMSPQRPDLVLATNIPHSKTDVLVLDSLDVETDRRDCGNNFTQLQFVKYRGFACCVEPHHEDSHLLAAEHALP